MISTISQLKDIVNELKASNTVDAAAIVRRDGVLMASNFSHSTLGKEVFGMMCATILGAAKNITKKGSMGLPSRVTIETKEGNLLITGAGHQAMLICLKKDMKESTSLSEALDGSAAKISKIL